MLETYSQNIAIANNAVIPFNTNSLEKNCIVTHVEGSTGISLNRPGVYAVCFNGSGVVTAGGVFGVQMLNNGNRALQAAASATVGAGETGSIAFSTLVLVKPSCGCVKNNALLTFQYIGGDGNISNVDVIVLKVS